MSKFTRRQVIGAVAAGATFSAETAHAGPEKEQTLSFDFFLPMQLTMEDIQASKGVKFTKIEFAGSTFWLGIFDLLGGGVPHASIGFYAPDKDGVLHRSLIAESWAAGKIEAAVNAKTGILELREGANSDLKGQIVLACNLKTIGTQHSIEAK